MHTIWTCIWRENAHKVYILGPLYIKVWHLNPTVLELVFEMIKVLFFFNRNQTHTFDTLQHQSLGFMFNVLKHSMATAIKYSFNSWSVVLSCKTNLGIDIRHVYKPMWMVHIYIYFFLFDSNLTRQFQYT
jgi:hypothetical protein